MRRLSAACSIAALCLFVPSLSFAQVALTGVVKDPSGAVLPGVTVEASSPALIEKVRATVTDDQWPLPHRRPPPRDLHRDVYALGFNTVRREGIVLEGTFTATVSADIWVGAVEETVTVTGETPVVDVQSVQRQTMIDNDLITAIPARARTED